MAVMALSAMVTLMGGDDPTHLLAAAGDVQFAPPPYYLNPVQAQYIAAVFAEVAPAY